MSPAPIILWFRRDLRLEDHAALSEALKGGSPILPLYIHETETVPSMGAASQWWLHHALQAHEARLRALEARLIVRQGDPAEVLAKLIAETGAKAVYASRAYDRSTDALDHTMQGFLDKRHITWKTFGGHLIWEPTEVRNKSGKPFQVFTPFWRAQSQGFEPGKPLPAPTHWPSPQQWP
ncbi:MAG: deoxyribodipyrimidine photo-lyase, partial [Verrucomicrobiota bacterium]|nr:deoxyribodipyrimidine photo-lyase [Verrucomicrobiota bacterium]